MSENTEITCQNCGASYRAEVDTNRPNWVSKCPICRAVMVVTKSHYPLLSAQVEKSPYVAPEPETYEPPPDGTEVRCDNPQCGRDLIGKWEGGLLHVKYRERSMRIEGIIWVPCRRCNKMVMIDTSAFPVAMNAFGDDYTLTVNEVDATDAALDLATIFGVVLRNLRGTGKDGRITKPDVEKYLDEIYGVGKWPQKN